MFHNGDIHISREFIKIIINKVRETDKNVSFFYSHSNNENLLNDIKELKFDKNIVNTLDKNTAYTIRDNDLYINTWYGCNNQFYLKKYGITIDCLYALFSDVCSTMFKFSLRDTVKELKQFYPSIDYNSFYISDAEKFLLENKNKKIFISNGKALSYQAHNFLLTPIILDIAAKHKDKTFILTNVEGNYTFPDNVIYSSNIIKKETCDLNENSFIASNCDIIIGRASGPFSFAITQDNLFNRNTTFLSFSNLISNKFWTDILFNEVNYSAKFVMSNENNINIIKQIIENYI